MNLWTLNLIDLFNLIRTSKSKLGLEGMKISCKSGDPA